MEIHIRPITRTTRDGAMPILGHTDVALIWDGRVLEHEELAVESIIAEEDGPGVVEVELLRLERRPVAGDVGGRFHGKIAQEMRVEEMLDFRGVQIAFGNVLLMKYLINVCPLRL